MEEKRSNDVGARREWHLEKTVSVSHIFSTISAIAVLVVLGSQFNTRLTLVEQAVAVQRDTEARQDKESQEYRLEIKTMISRINDKLDRMIETRR